MKVLQEQLKIRSDMFMFGILKIRSNVFGVLQKFKVVGLQTVSWHLKAETTFDAIQQKCQNQKSREKKLINFAQIAQIVKIQFEFQIQIQIFEPIFVQNLF